jgi:hypothetical protein
VTDRTYDRNELDAEDEDAIRAALVGRTVTKVDDETLRLDDGTTLTLGGNEGCRGCSNGWYELTELNDCPVNAIMAVEFQREDHDIDWTDPAAGDKPATTYRIFVLAEDRRIKLAQFDGDDGNGYYGSGYWIRVERAAP